VYVPENSAEHILHDKLAYEQHGNTDQHSCLDGIVSDQAENRPRVEQEGNQHQQKPAHGYGKDHPSSEVPAIPLDKADRLLSPVEGPSANQRDVTVGARIIQVPLLVGLHLSWPGQRPIRKPCKLCCGIRM